MTATWNPAPPERNAPESVRLMANAAGPAFLVMAANAMLMLAGGGADFPAFEAAATALPALASAVAWIVLLTLLGLARFELSRGGDPQTFAIDALIVAAMIYPFSANAFGAHWTVANTLTVLGMAAMAMVAAFPQSRRAAMLLTAPAAWLGWSSCLAVAAAT